jgi:twitching motility protein PilT
VVIFIALHDLGGLRADFYCLVWVDVPSIPRSRSSPAMNIHDLLNTLVQMDCSDLHIAAGTVPMFRLNGEIVLTNNIPPTTPAEVEEILFKILTQEQQGELHKQKELDFSVGLPGIGRFRCNIHRQRGTWAAAFRKIPPAIPSLSELGLPDIVNKLILKESGLILVTGPTGSGKSMTLAAMIEAINQTRACHIITIEDPIEFLFKNKNAFVEQREVGSDTPSFASALSHIFRQDPDIIMVGEMRDQETLATAITCAATGRLVLGTLHTVDAVSTINRLIESFPADQQVFMQAQIAGCLEGVISQQLVTQTDQKGRVLAAEILISTPSIRNLIRSGKSVQIQNDIEVGRKNGMQSMIHALSELVTSGKVKLEEALRHTRFPDDLMQRIGLPK